MGARATRHPSSPSDHVPLAPRIARRDPQRRHAAVPHARARRVRRAARLRTPTMRLALYLVTLAACGRVNFDAPGGDSGGGSSDGDASTGDGAMPGGPDANTCI